MTILPTFRTVQANLDILKKGSHMRQTGRAGIGLLVALLIAVFTSSATPVAAQTASAHKLSTEIQGDANPMFDEMMALPAADRNLDVEGISAIAAPQTNTNINFPGFRVAPSYPAHKSANTNAILSSVTGDFNKDGLQDMVVFQGTALTLMLGDGKGGFTNGGSSSTGSYGIAKAVAVDLNGDGYLDLLVMSMQVGYGGKVFVMLNQKNNTFSAMSLISQTASVYSGLVDFVVADINGDGNPDVLISGMGTTDTNPNSYIVFETVFGNGDGTFKTTSIVPTVGTLPYKANVGYSGGTVLRTINGQLTLVAPIWTTHMVDGRNTSSFAMYQFPVNSSGTVNVSGATSTAMQVSVHGSPLVFLTFADVNGDGIDDMALNQLDGEIYIALGKGNNTYGAFNYAMTLAFTAPGASVAFKDVNKDGLPDMIIAGATVIAVYPGNGDGTFGNPKTTYLPGSGDTYSNGLTAPIPGNSIYDFDGDGNLDVVFADSAKRTLSFYKGKSDGTFVGAKSLTSNNDSLQDNIIEVFAAFDMNGDGNKDLFTYTEYGFESGINDGKGNFTYKIAIPSLSGIVSISPVTADFNQDGLNDVVAITEDSSYNYHVYLCYSNGDGTFKPVLQTLPFAATTLPSIAIADLNGDGYPDMVLSQTTYSPATYGVWTLINNKGTLASNSNFISLGKTIYGLAVGDVTGDGYPEMFVSYGAYAATTVGEWKNPGTGLFSSTASVAVQSTLPVGLMTVANATGSGKGDLLAAVTNGTSEGIVLYPGNGDGTFATPVQIASNMVVSKIGVADFNNDGNPDIYFDNKQTVLTDAADGTFGTLVVPGAGNGSFAPQVDNLTYGGSSFLIPIDLYNSGSLDLLEGNSTGTVILQNRGAAKMSMTSSINSGDTATVFPVTIKVTPFYNDQYTPTGAITLKVDGSTYQTASLDSLGEAVFSLSSLTAGTHSVTAVYAGDTNFNTIKSSTASTLTVTKATPSFTLTSNTSVLQVTNGASGSSTLSLTANSSFSGPVTLSCSNLPALTTCVFGQNSITLAPGATSTTTLSVSTTTASASLIPYGSGSTALAGMLLLGLLARRRKKAFIWLSALLLSATLFTATGCSTKQTAKLANGIYAVTVVATPANTDVKAQSVAVTLSVQSN